MSYNILRKILFVIFILIIVRIGCEVSSQLSIFDGFVNSSGEISSAEVGSKRISEPLSRIFPRWGFGPANRVFRFFVDGLNLFYFPQAVENIYLVGLRELLFKENL
jgi:hypothetical protein